MTSAHRRNDNRIFLKECRSLADAGFDVNLVVMDGLGDATIGGIRILDAGAKRGTRFGRMTGGVWRVFRKALETKANLFILHDPELLTVAPLLRRHGKVIFDMHENTPKQLESKEWIPRAVRRPAARLFALLERVLMRGLPVIFAEKSYRIEYPWIKENIAALNMPRAEIFGEIRKSARKRDLFTVGYMGEVAEKRGSITALKALGILRKKQLPFFFECIGHAEPGHEKELRSLSKALGIADNVNFRGYMQNEHGLKIMADCHVGLAVLRAVPNYTNSSSTKLFEYVLLGLPAIISDFPIYRQMVTENRFFYTVPPDDPSALAEALQDLMELGNCHEELEKNALLAADKYSWTEEEKQLVAFVRQILG